MARQGCLVVFLIPYRGMWATFLLPKVARFLDVWNTVSVAVDGSFWAFLLPTRSPQVRPAQHLSQDGDLHSNSHSVSTFVDQVHHRSHNRTYRRHPTPTLLFWLPQCRHRLLWDVFLGKRVEPDGQDKQDDWFKKRAHSMKITGESFFGAYKPVCVERMTVKSAWSTSSLMLWSALRAAVFSLRLANSFGFEVPHSAKATKATNYIGWMRMRIRWIFILWSVNNSSELSS